MKNIRLIIAAVVLVMVAIIVFSRKHPASDATHTTASAPALSPEEAHVQAHLDSLRDAMRLEMQETLNKAGGAHGEDEYSVDGLVLLQKTLKVDRAEHGREIVGMVVNRRNKALSYAQISFNLYDEAGAQVGSAAARVDHLDAGGQWNFKALAREDNWKSFKVAELTGF
jgi:hypothetical protein